MDTVPCATIGYIRSPYVDTAKTPVQASLNMESAAEVVVIPEYTEALTAVEEFFHMWIISLLAPPLRQLTSMTEIPHLLLDVPC